MSELKFHWFSLVCKCGVFSPPECVVVRKICICSCNSDMACFFHTSVLSACDSCSEPGRRDVRRKRKERWEVLSQSDSFFFWTVPFFGLPLMKVRSEEGGTPKSPCPPNGQTALFRNQAVVCTDFPFLQHTSKSLSFQGLRTREAATLLCSAGICWKK